MALPAKKMEGYTFADILASGEDERFEIIDGEAFLMAPPNTAHQAVSFEIARQLGNFLEGKKCRAFTAPFGVRLFEKDGDRPEDVATVVEPDISVICDPSKIDQRGCKGAPDLIIEILSPSTRRYDRVVKLDLYQRAGVREYWIVNPEDKSVSVMLRDESGFLLPREDYGREDPAKVHALEDCEVDLRKVFPE